MRKSLAAILVTCSLCACQLPQTTKIEGSTQQDKIQNNEQVQLTNLIEQAWQLNLNADPQLDHALGNQAKGGHLADLSPEFLEKQNQSKVRLLKQIRILDVSKLSKDEQINAHILRDQLQNDIDQYHFNSHFLPITAESGFHAYITSIAKGRFNTAQDYQDYISKLEALPNYFKQQTYWLKQGLEQGITPARVVLKGFESSISAYIVATEKSGYYKPFTQYPSHFSEEQKKALSKRGFAIINDKILPLYQDFYDFMVETYIPNARQETAAYALPNGEAFYENRVAYYTTLDMTSDEVHQLGLKEVKRIRGEMDKIIEQVEFKGSFAEFLHFLRTDPQFYPKTKEELLKEAAFIAKKADAMLPKYFGKLPRTPYGIAEVPLEIAPKYTTGRYSGSNADDQPGYYWVNTYALDKRPLYEMEALTLHEAVPGHHLQISLNKELTELPNFRRYSYISAFGEGWGLYSEYLGLEAGFYQDPYSNFGRLTYEMWRAARLVVDTGLHAKGWNRQQAIDFMASNTALSMHNVTTEIDRYISWPGQALSYKIGELTIKRLRKQAEQALGNKFDIRSFHDAILANGSVPMSILEQQIVDYIKEHKGS